MRRFTVFIMILFILCMFGFSAWFYPKLPEYMASHWNAQGQVDDYMPRHIGAFVIPGAAVFITVLFWAMGRIDPFRRNFNRFHAAYDVLQFLLILFLFAVQVFVFAWNLGFKIRVNFLMPVLLSFLFFAISIVMEKVGPNWLIGIRTPWTLSNEKVWRKTHICSAILFKLAAAVMLFGGMMVYHSVLFVIIPIFSALLISVMLSYIFYRQETSAR